MYQFNNGIKKIRKRRDISQRKLAELAGVSMQTVSLIERGKSAANEETKERLAVALGVDLWVIYLYGDSEKWDETRELRGMAAGRFGLRFV